MEKGKAMENIGAPGGIPCMKKSHLQLELLEYKDVSAESSE